MSYTRRIRRRVTPFLWYCIVVALLISSFSSLALPVSAKETASVLIINSYHEGFQWTDDLTSGVVSEIKKLNKSIEIYVERLDWKRFPDNDIVAQQLAHMRTKYAHTTFDVVITSDDAALRFAKENRDILFPSVPIVFGGVLKQNTDLMLDGVSNVTGVYEAVDPDGTLDMILAMHPDVENIFVFHDGTESGISSRENLAKALVKKSPKTILSDIDLVTTKRTLQEMQGSPLKSVAVIVALYAKIDGIISEPSDFASFISESGIPTYSFYEYSLGSGIVGGSLLSGYRHGQAMGVIASRLLSGESVQDIPISSVLSVEAKVDDRVIRQLKIARSSLPDNLTLINKPFSFFETYRTLVLSTISVFVILMILILMLIRSNRARLKAEIALTANHDELSQTYEELAATHDELTSTHEELLASQDDLRDQYANLEDEQIKSHRLAHFDPLTGLPNRLMLKEAANAAIANASPNSRIVLFFIDTDNFKLINDSFGHIVGDMLLVSVGKRILAHTGELGLAARLGGDEFIVIQELGATEDPNTLAKSLLDVFERPFIIAENTFYISVSIGVVMYPDHGTTFDELLKNADTSMYRAKDAGKGRFTFFTSAMNEMIVARTNLQRMIRDSLDRNEFSLYYQPKVDAQSRTIVGFEALCRWIQPDGSMIPPDKFIPIAEEAGLIILLGNFVLREACHFIQRLKASNNALPVSVNVSVVQLMHGQFVENVLAAINECDLEPSDIILEITESVLMESFETNINKLNSLQSAGITLSLDDFGTGYSSLTYLKQMPLKELKIDKSFICDLAHTPDQEGIIRTIVQLAKQLNLHVVAEGVETSDQAAFLMEIGCATLQGYHFSKPLPEQAIHQMLLSGKTF